MSDTRIGRHEPPVRLKVVRVDAGPECSLVKMRRDGKVSAEEVAAALGLTASTVRAMEGGARRVTPAEVVAYREAVRSICVARLEAVLRASPVAPTPRGE